MGGCSWWGWVGRRVGEGGLILLGVALALLVGEVFLRLFPNTIPLAIQYTIAQKPGPHRPMGLPAFFEAYRVLWEEDDFIEDHIKPGVDVVLRGNPEFPAWHLQTDDLGMGPAGFRDTLPAEDPFALVLGDSFGFGVGVAHEEIWVERLEQATGRPFVNLSQVGMSSLQEGRIYARYGRQLPVKLVVWMFFENDLKENLGFAQWVDPESPVASAAVVPQQRCDRAWHQLGKDYSFLYEFLIYAGRLCEYATVPARPRYHDQELDLTFCLNSDVCHLDVQRVMREAGWPLTEQVLDETIAQVRARGAEFLLVIAPSKEQVYWEQFQQVSRFPPDYDIDQLVAPVRRYCEQKGLACVDLTGAFRAQARQKQQLYFPIDIHWNAQGNALAAEIIHNYLEEQGLFR